MPIVSVNLSPAAYALYENAMQTRTGSAMTSRAILYFASRDMLHEHEDGPSVELGDTRRSVTGDVLVWTKTKGRPAQWEVSGIDG